jgi:ABC-type glycerol-3-phosphate transport system substrate-binding protein
MNQTNWILVLVAATGLSACGGGGSDNASPPPSASASPDGYIAYVQALVASDSGTLEPVDVNTVTPQRTETAEPMLIN